MSAPPVPPPYFKSIHQFVAKILQHKFSLLVHMKNGEVQSGKKPYTKFGMNPSFKSPDNCDEIQTDKVIPIYHPLVEWGFNMLKIS